MKLKEIKRTATTAWAPTHSYKHEDRLCPLLATASVSGALDATFSSSTELEVFALDLDTPSPSEGLLKIGSASCTARFNRLGWTSAGPGQYGLIAGAMEDGSLDIWNGEALMNGKGQAALSAHKQAHSGAVRSLDFNPFQGNLLATGASSAEISIWDLNNADKPYSPGAKSQKLEDVGCLAWNRQIVHILASASTNGLSVIWDLKTRREIINLTAPTRKPVTAIAWNPDVSTQVLTASDDDQSPVIYVWDLRNAHAPEKVLEGHSKGVLGLSWCAKDSGLLLSCGKDNRTLCWNPKSAEIIGEFPHSDNWVFDVQWCPRHPDLLSTSSFDGNVSVYSILGKSAGEQAPLSPSGALANDPFAPTALGPGGTSAFTLAQPPKWLRRQVGATFGFGNKLCAFSAKKDANAKPGNPVTVYQVVANKEFASRAKKLETAVEKSEFGKFCQEKVSASTAGPERTTWEFLARLLDNNSREKIVELLGFSKEALAAKLDQLKISDKAKASASKVDQVAPPDTTVKDVVVAPTDDAEGQAATEDAAPADALFGGSNDAASSDLDFLASQTAANNIPPVDGAVGTPVVAGKKFSLYHGADKDSVDNSITRCVALGDYDSAVQLCMQNERFDDALVLAVCGGSELLERTKTKYFERKQSQHSYLRIASSIAAQNLSDIVECIDVARNWRETLALLCTYATAEEFAALSNTLAERVRAEMDKTADKASKEDLLTGTVFAFICAANFEKVITIWMQQEQARLLPFAEKVDKLHLSLFSTKEFAHSLQSLLEKIAAYSNVINYSAPPAPSPNDSPAPPNATLATLYAKYSVYAGLLVDQGLLVPALEYMNLAHGFKLPTNLVKVFKHTIYEAIPRSEAPQFKDTAPAFPFDRVQVASPLSVAEPPSAKASPTKSSVAVADTTNGTMKQLPPAPGGQQTYGSYGNQYGNAQFGGYGASAGATQPYQTGYGAPPAQQQAQAAPPPPTASSYYNTQQPQQQQPQQTGYQNSYQAQYQYGSSGAPQQSAYGGGYQPYGAAGQQAAPPQTQPPSQQNEAYGAARFVPQPPPIFGVNNSASTTNVGSGAVGGVSGPTSPSAAVPPSQMPYAKMPGFNDPPADVFKAPKQVKHAAPITSPFPGQQQQGNNMAQPGGAPQSYQQQGQGVPPNYGYAAQGPAGGQGPPQTAIPQAAPRPPTGQFPSAAAQPAQPMQQQQRAPEPARHPMGDRSHILPEQKVIFETLSRCLNQCKPIAALAQKKFLDDAEKRLNVLFDRLNNQEVGQAAVAQLLLLANAVGSKDWATAASIHQTLLTAHASEGTQWIVGVKRLIDVGKVLL